MTDIYNVISAPMPTFIKDIFRTNGYVKIISNKVNINCEETIIETIEKPTEESELNLTGNPLEVDLGDHNDSVTIKQSETWKNWTKNEEEYYPISVDLSMNILNKLSKTSTLQFCVTKDNTPRKTLLIGREKENFQRYLVNFYGCYTLDEQQVQISTFKKRHLRDCGANKNTNLKVHVLYRIFGYNKLNAQDMMNINKNVNNSAFIETTTHEETFEWTCNIKQKLYLQVNLNKASSMLYPLFEELNMINNLMDILQEDDDIGNIEIGTNTLTFQQVVDKMNELLASNSLNDVPVKLDKKTSILNVKNMRPLNFLEKLWNLVISLKNFEEISECFHILFQNIVDNDGSINILEFNDTLLGNVIKCLNDGSLVLHKHNLQTVMQYLIDLGLNKVFHDYLFLMEDKFQSHFIEAWRIIAESAMNDNKNKNKNKIKDPRKSRISLCAGLENLIIVKKQLNCLSHMALVTELMQLVKECSFHSKIENQCYNYIIQSESLKKSFKTLKTEGIVDFECEINTSNDYINKLSAVSINVNFSSETHTGLIQTIYHFSDMPIFPENIFNYTDYDTITKRNGKFYYVHEGKYIRSKISL